MFPWTCGIDAGPSLLFHEQERQKYRSAGIASYQTRYNASRGKFVCKEHCLRRTNAVTGRKGMASEGEVSEKVSLLIWLRMFVSIAFRCRRMAFLQILSPGTWSVVQGANWNRSPGITLACGNLRCLILGCGSPLESCEYLAAVKYGK